LLSALLTGRITISGTIAGSWALLNLLLLFLLVLPLSSLALLASLVLLGVITLGGAIHLVADVERLGLTRSRRTEVDEALR
jgi:hypothetical protein